MCTQALVPALLLLSLRMVNKEEEDNEDSTEGLPLLRDPRVGLSGPLPQGEWVRELGEGRAGRCPNTGEEVLFGFRGRAKQQDVAGPVGNGCRKPSGDPSPAVQQAATRKQGYHSHRCGLKVWGRPWEVLGRVRLPTPCPEHFTPLRSRGPTTRLRTNFLPSSEM